MLAALSMFDLRIPGCGSLKEKRHVVKTISAGLRSKFNVSVAEVDHHDLWQRAALGVSCVAESSGRCHMVLQEVEKLIGRTVVGGAEIVDRSIDVVGLDDL